MSISIRYVLFATLLCQALPILSQAAEQDISSKGTSERVFRGQTYQLEYAGAEKLPNFEIEGQPAKIHTQGIYLTNQSLYVTGRLERNPKRALLLRFNRSNLKLKEYLDITPSADTPGIKPEPHDHPGGFDYDGNCFWIPVAISRRHSATVVVKICTTLDSPLTRQLIKTAFLVDDHIGAIACDRAHNRLAGANWDTKAVYLWHSDGMLIKRISREELIQKQPDWSLAVQDWKGLTDGILLAGAVDKGPLLQQSQSRAVIQWIDIPKRRVLDTIRLPRPSPEAHRQTREGMAFFDGQLFLLPGDLGEDAILYRYRIESASQPNQPN
jgi:hypothetical protein